MALFSQNGWLKITVRLALFFRASGSLVSEFTAFEKKSGDDYESYSEWLGIKDLDITYFNKNAVNKSLKKEIKAIDKAYKNMDE